MLGLRCISGLPPSGVPLDFLEDAFRFPWIAVDVFNCTLLFYVFLNGRFFAPQTDDTANSSIAISGLVSLSRRLDTLC